MEMPPIAGCEVTDCCYNFDRKCHALAIQVGDGATHPVCDTYAGSQASQCGDPSASGNVGACKVSSCEYNQNLECMAQSITVGYREDEPDCLTFEMK
ncbi:MAG: hypothetical protein A2Y77_15365 [Planctomycetes bacterium RBG_13_62_9]|nr:MAG: hypothetical protein A2Y77_15365 [Planctomycetes bacterium RBG_13_62_9]